MHETLSAVLLPIRTASQMWSLLPSPRLQQSPSRRVPSGAGVFCSQTLVVRINFCS